MTVTTDQNNAADSTTTYNYNQLGQITRITDSLDNVTTFTYDYTGNLLEIIDPEENITEMTYYDNGSLWTVTDARRNTTTYAYDSKGRLWTATEQIGGVTSQTIYTYNSDDQLLTVEDAKHHTITYGYESLPPTGLGRLASMTDQLQKTETYQYDAYNNIEYVTDRKGQRTHYEYTALNQLSKVTYEADGSTTELVYYPSGKVQTITDSISGTLSYDYYNDGCTSCSSGKTGKLKSETNPLGTVSYEYDKIGRKTKMTVDGQPDVIYSYPHVFPRRQEIQTTINGVSKTFVLQADQLGRSDTLTFPNGVTTKYALYDNASRLKTLKHLDPLQNVLESIGYTYDENGNRTRVDRQTSVTLPMPTNVSGITPDAANRIPSFNGGNVSHDYNGNMTSWTFSCGGINRTQTYSWDVRGRLVGISGYKPDCTSTPLSASFKYDALGRRIEKTINGRTIKYLYDGYDIVQEIENGSPTVNYIRTLNIDEPLARIELTATPNRVRYYHTDALGNIIGLSNESGQMVTTYAYDAFGDVTVSGEPSDNPFQYTGRENDGTGLYYYRARYYNPMMQRFISEDPIRLKGGDINFFSYVDSVGKPVTETNLYMYAQNNPINRVDPTGEVSIGPAIPYLCVLGYCAFKDMGHRAAQPFAILSVEINAQ